MLTAQYRQSAIDWLNGKRDFKEGLAILKQSGFKPGVVRRLESIGESETTLMHLKENIYLYIQFIGKDSPEDTDADLGVIQGKQPVVLKQEDEKARSIDEMAMEMDLSSATPTGTNRAVMMYAELYRARERAHREMAKVPETNSEENVEARRLLSDKIDSCTSQMEKLYPLIKDYLENKKEISHEELDNLMKEETEKEDEDGDGGDDYDKLPKAELQKRLKSAKTKILKKRNLLEFQQEAKASAPNPLPDCPKRVKYETEIAQLEKEVEALQYAIARKA